MDAVDAVASLFVLRRFAGAESVDARRLLAARRRRRRGPERERERDFFDFEPVSVVDDVAADDMS